MKLLIISTVAILAICHGFPTNVKPGFQELDEYNSFRLKHLRKGDNADMYSGQFEGDIILTPAQVDAIMGRNGLILDFYRWTNNTIPYVIEESDFTYEQLQHIRKGLDQLELTSCLKFVPWTGEKDYVAVSGRQTGCWSYVGRLGGRQELNLQPYSGIENGCVTLGIIMHEFIHAVGFYHMQSSYDRDDYVDIKWENIMPGTENNFEKYSDRVITDFDVPYDYNSVMHYGPDGFSVNGQPTIVPKDPNANIGQRIGLSRRDIEKINRMYNCPW